MRSDNLKEADLLKVEESTISITEMYTAKERAARDPKVAAESALKKMSVEDIKELFEKYAQAEK